MTQEHTPVPWEAHGAGVYRAGTMQFLAATGDDGDPREGAEQEANAGFIVRACNAHDQLVEAAEQMRAALSLSVTSYGLTTHAAEAYGLDQQYTALCASLRAARGEGVV